MTQALDLGMPEPDESNEKDRGRLNMTIAVTVAILTTFMAICKIKDDNIVQSMQVTQSSIVDTWSQYQAKRIRQAMTQDAQRQAQLIREIVPPEARARVDAMIKDDQHEIAHYDKDKKTLSDKAKGMQADYDALSNRDDQFDLSEALLSMALAMLAMCALTQKRFLLYTGWVLMGLGMVMGVAGFAQWTSVHPDAIIKFLT